MGERERLPNPARTARYPVVAPGRERRAGCVEGPGERQGPRIASDARSRARAHRRLRGEKHAVSENEQGF